MKAFRKAFSILHHTLSSSSEDVKSRPVIILLISDEGQRRVFVQNVVIHGVKKEFEAFRKKFTTTELNLVILSFGKDMAFFDQLADATGGKSASIAVEGDYYSRLQPYFDQLIQVIPPVQRKVVLSHPYVDAFGLGYMITATCAVIDGEKKFRGIVGMDILMPDLVSNVQYFKDGTLQSYAFMFQTHNGLALSHPMIQTPETVSKEQNPIHILELEDSKEFKELYEEVVETALAQGEDISSKTITVLQRSRAAGGVMGDGIVREDVDYEYTCQPLDTENKEYITCIAIKSKESYDKYGSSRIFDSAGNHPSAYHRIDVLPEAKTCYHMDSVSYPDRSAVKFSPKAFVNPADYFGEQERLEAVRLYSKQLFEETRPGGTHDGQEPPIHRNMPIVAILTSYFDRMVWGSGSEKFKRFTRRFVRRYVGTYSGVLRVFPPAPLPTTFDHTTRPWFISAVANDGYTTVTHPYLDPLGAGFVVSISHTVTREMLDPSLTNDHKIFAVVGGDLTVSSLGASLSREMGDGCVYKKELRCFLMDTRGYIIYHPDFEEAYNDSSLVVDKHITAVDGEIAQDLIKNGVMKRQECRNLQRRKLQRFYVVNIEGEIYRGEHGACDYFTVAKIPKTNVFVVKVKSKLCLVNRESCACEGICLNDDCECPCNAPMDYDICKAELLSGHDIPICAQPSPPVAPRPPLPVHPDDLSQCVKVQCSHHFTELDCNEQYGCAWCTTNFTTNLVLKKHSCRRDRECFGGSLGRKNPFLLPFRPKEAKEKVEIINVLGIKFTTSSFRTTGICVGVGVLVIIVLVWWCKRKDQWEVEFDEMMGGQEFMDHRLSTMTMAQRQSTMQMSQMHMGQRQSAMHMGQRQSAMHMGQRQSAMHMGAGPSTLQMGQRTSNMQLMMNPGMQYSSQAMTGMWSTQGFGGQSQMMGSMSMAGNTQFFNFDTY